MADVLLHQHRYYVDDPNVSHLQAIGDTPQTWRWMDQLMRSSCKEEEGTPFRDVRLIAGLRLRYGALSRHSPEPSLIDAAVLDALVREGILRT